MDKKLVYVGFAFHHHRGTHAGYHQILDYLHYDYVVDCQSFIDKGQKVSKGIFQRAYRHIMRRYFGIENMPWYLLRILWLGLRYNNLVFHYIYGENVFFPWVRKFMRKGNIVVCTIHQPSAFFQTRENYRRKILESDNVILVGKTEIANFNMMTGKKNVVYIPHGISTNFYKVNVEIRKKKRVLTVGNWLRDYEFADRVYKRLIEKNPNIEIHVVSLQQNRKFLTMSEQLTFMSNISDEELLKEYLECSVLFLPLVRYTANNSLLEASATGCNIVISSNHPDNSYIPENYLTIVEMDVDATVAGIEAYMGTSYNMPLSHFIEENYSWQQIGLKTEEYLRSL